MEREFGNQGESKEKQDKSWEGREKVGRSQVPGPITHAPARWRCGTTCSKATLVSGVWLSGQCASASQENKVQQVHSVM